MHQRGSELEREHCTLTVRLVRLVNARAIVNGLKVQELGPDHWGALDLHVTSVDEWSGLTYSGGGRRLTLGQHQEHQFISGFRSEIFYLL